MSRLFTFGCSFTQYGWPTWADIIAYDKDVEYYNYAVAGLGNVGIAHRILEADLKHKFRDGDEIFILWTSWSREDRVKDAAWVGRGSVLTHNSHHYDKSFLKKYWDFDNDVVKNSTAIITTNRLFKNFIIWQASASEFFTNEGSNKSKHKFNNIIKLYKRELPDLKVIPCETKNPFKIVRDSHPDVLGHLNLATQIYKDLDLTIKDNTRDTFIRLQHDIENVIKETDNFEQVLDKVKAVMILNYKKLFSIRNYRSLNEDWHIS